MNYSRNHSWSTPIDKLMQWRSGSWMKYCSNPVESLLVIYYDQLFITAGDKVLETLNFNEKTKGFYKGDILIIVTNDAAQQVRKIKFQIKTDASECIKKLKSHFPVLGYNSVQSKNVFYSQYSNMETVLKNAMEKKGFHGSTVTPPPNFSNFVKLCLLDSSFPQFVNESQKVIDSFHK